MTIKQIADLLNSVVGYLRQQEQDRADELADLHDELAHMRSRLDTLEVQVGDMV